LISTRQLTKIYNKGEPNEVAALQDVSIEIKSGDFVLVKGPSGSGKSTLLSLVGLLCRPTKGRIFYDGEEVSSYSDAWQARMRREKTGFVFQQHNLLPQFPVWGNVSLPLTCRDVNGGEQKKKALNILERLGLGSRWSFRTAQLSVGEQQRVAIARALVTDPEIVLADEPTASVDEETSLSVLQIFLDLKKLGRTLIVVSHDPLMAEQANVAIELRSGLIKSLRRA